MAFYMFGDYIREQRERMGVTQEDLCEGICSPGTLSKIENGRQGVRLNQYIALMERLGLPVQPMGVQVTEEEMRWYNLKQEISYKISSGCRDVEELLARLEKCSYKADRITEQYVSFVRAGIKMGNGNNGEEVFDMLLRAIRYTLPRFDFNNINNVKLLTFDEIMIIDNIAIMMRKQGDIIKAIMWGYFLKEYLEKGNIDYDEKVRIYPMILFNLSNWLIGCGRYNDADEICSKGIEYCNTHGKLNIFMELLYNRGICYAETGDKKNAAQFFTYSYVIAEARGDKKRANIIEETLAGYGISKVMM